MPRNEAYRRAQTRRVIKRKEDIVRYAYRLDPEECGWYGHRLDKGKVHCSCPMCSEKTKRNGWKHSDLQKIEKGNWEG